MNITALTAAFNSLSFRARLHGALIKAAKCGVVSTVTNRRGKPALVVSYSRETGFKFTHDNIVIPTKIIYNFLRETV